jgi:hypothetical protein
LNLIPACGVETITTTTASSATTTSAETEHRSKLDAAKEEEKHMREKCTTQELKMAVAVVHSLEGICQ